MNKNQAEIKNKASVSGELDEFENICKMTQQQLKTWCKQRLCDIGYPKVFWAGNSKKKTSGFIFAQGTHPVLLVAHLDTVHSTVCTDVCVSPSGWLMSPQGIGGDDRCGIYMALKIAEVLKCSVLFCEDEETGNQGAKAFESYVAQAHIKPWVDSINFIVEFDRMNSHDAVFYDCENVDFTTFIESTGYFKEANGSRSDISTIAPAMKVAAVNLSCGYYNQHMISESVNWFIMWKNITEAYKLINCADMQKYEYVEATYVYHGYDKDDLQWYKHWKWDYERKMYKKLDEATNEYSYHDAPWNLPKDKTPKLPEPEKDLMDLACSCCGISMHQDECLCDDMGNLLCEYCYEEYCDEKAICTECGEWLSSDEERKDKICNICMVKYGIKDSKSIASTRCLYCDKKLPKERPYENFCSLACKVEYEDPYYERNKKTREVCAFCGLEITRSRYYGSDGILFDTSYCRDAYYKEKKQKGVS